MGNSQTDCKKSCKAIGDCQGDGGTVVEEKGPEVVDMSQFEAKGQSSPAPATTKEASLGEEGNAGKGPRQRRTAFDVVLERSGKHWRTLGLLVSPDDDPRYLIIDDIWEPSLVSEWNAAHDEAQRVRAGDIIISVNESVCNGEEMLSKIQALGKGASIQLRVE